MVVKVIVRRRAIWWLVVIFLNDHRAGRWSRCNVSRGLSDARRLHRLLEEKNIPHVYEEFADDHSGIDYRMDRSLPLLVNALLA